MWDWAISPQIAAGHAVLILNDHVDPAKRTYISWWPDGQSPQSLTMQEYFKGTAVQDRSFLDDGRAEGGHAPQTLEAIPGLDIDAIKTWWKTTTYQTTHGYQLHWNTCARTVFNAIWAGGGRKLLPPNAAEDFERIIAWKPVNVISLSYAIRKAQLGILPPARLV